jgi:hypothetical protein
MFPAIVLERTLALFLGEPDGALRSHEVNRVIVRLISYGLLLRMGSSLATVWSQMLTQRLEGERVDGLSLTKPNLIDIIEHKLSLNWG